MRRPRGIRPGDRGSSAIEWAGLLGLVSALIVALIAAGLPQSLSQTAREAICRMLGHCPGSPGEAADPHEPRQDCTLSTRAITVDGVVNARVKVLGVRAERRVTVTTGRVLEPGGGVRYDVTIAPNLDVGGSATLGLPGKNGGSVGAWISLQGTNGRVYSFRSADFGGDEATAQDAAQRFADKLWLDQAQNDALTTTGMALPAPLGAALKAPGVQNAIKRGANWLIGKSAPATSWLPGIGDNIARAADAPDRDLAKPDQHFFEGGPSGGGELSLPLGGAAELWAFGRGFVNAGVRFNHNNPKYHRSYYFRMDGGIEGAASIDLGTFAPPSARARVGDWLSRTERQLAAKTGGKVTIPQGIRDKIAASWPYAGIAAKKRGSQSVVVVVDKHNNPTEVRLITETQLVFSVRGFGRRSGDVSGEFAAQPSLYGSKELTQSVLPLDGSHNAANRARTADFLKQAGLDMAQMNPTTFAGAGRGAEYYAYARQNGQTYRQSYDSGVLTFWPAGGVKSRGSGYAVLEPENNKLVSSEYFNPSLGWRPWTHCRAN